MNTKWTEWLDEEQDFFKKLGFKFNSDKDIFLINTREGKITVSKNEDGSKDIYYEEKRNYLDISSFEDIELILRILKKRVKTQISM